MLKGIGIALRGIFDGFIGLMQDLKVNKHFRIISAIFGCLEVISLLYILLFEKLSSIKYNNNDGIDIDTRVVILPLMILFSFFIETAAQMRRTEPRKK